MVHHLPGYELVAGIVGMECVMRWGDGEEGCEVSVEIIHAADCLEAETNL